MDDFLDRAEELLQTDKVPEAKEGFELVFRGLANLQRVAAKAHLDQYNLESVFASFEMAQLLGKLGDLTEMEVDALPDALRTVIEYTLMFSIPFGTKRRQELTDAEGIRRWNVPPGSYDMFVDILHELVSRQDRPRVSVVTFNYDLVLDYAFGWKQLPIDYGFEKSRDDRRIKYLKLHGSVNWLQCPGCGDIHGRKRGLVQFLRMLGKVGEPAVVHQLQRATHRAGACGWAATEAGHGLE